MKDVIELRPAIPIAGTKGQTDDEVITLLRDRYLAKAAVAEQRAAKNKVALERGGADRVHGDARKILEAGIATAEAEAPRLRRVAEVINTMLAKLSDDK